MSLLSTRVSEGTVRLELALLIGNLAGRFGDVGGGDRDGCTGGFRPQLLDRGIALLWFASLLWIYNQALFVGLEACNIDSFAFFT